MSSFQRFAPRGVRLTNCSGQSTKDFGGPTISVALALEYEDLLKRSDLVVGFSETEIEYFLDYILGQGNLITGVQRRRPLLPDADDERILELAVASGSMIVTHNTRHFTAAEPFGVEVATPAQFLRTLRSGK